MKTPALFLLAIVLGSASIACNQDDTVCTTVAQGSVSHLSFASSDATAGIVDVDLFADSGAPTRTNPEGCIDVRLQSGVIVMDCPSGPGSFALPDLGACFVSTPAGPCVPIDGVLVVQAFSRPCGGGACGRLDAVLDIEQSYDPAAVLRGSATLLYTESETQCSG